jgi:uncharacterized membrane protein
MKKETALKIIVVIAIAGMLFSGYLSYTEIFQQTCALGGSCSTKIFTLPSCVYGFVMYLIVLIISLLGLYGKKK